MPADTPTPTGPTTEPSSAPHGDAQQADGVSQPSGAHNVGLFLEIMMRNMDSLEGHSRG